MKSLLFLILINLCLFAKDAKPLLTFKNSYDILKIVEQYLPVDPVIIEAGAFKGEDSLRMAKKWKKGKIHSFEPIPDVYTRLKNNTQPYKNIQTYQLAIGQTVGVVQMHVSELSAQPEKSFGSSSLLPPMDHLKHAPHVKFPRTVEVKSSTFDTWANENSISHVDFMWLDMQGYELNALKASPKILDTVKVLLTEISFSEVYEGQHQFAEVKEWLENKGFVLIAIDTKYKWFGDAIFVKKSSIP